MLDTILAKVFGTKNERDIKALRPTIAAMGDLEPQMQQLSDAELAQKTQEFKQRLADGETLDDIMVEAFDVTGLGQSLRIAVGVLEICGGLCLFMPRASIYAAMVLGCTIVGILGATIGHMARLGIEQPALERPPLTRQIDFEALLAMAHLEEHVRCRRGSGES